MNIPRSLVSLSEMMHKSDATEKMFFFTVIPTHVIIFSVIECIWGGKQSLKDYLVFKIIGYLNERQRWGGFDQNKIRGMLKGCKYEILYKIVGDRGGSRREF